MPDTPARPVLFGQGYVSRALSDIKFFELLPEFRPVQALMNSMQVEVNTNRGCSGCKKRKAIANVYREFVMTMLTLSPDGTTRIKQYFGTPSIMLNVVDRKTGQASIKIL